jgi:hypothetical protein
MSTVVRRVGRCIGSRSVVPASTAVLVGVVVRVFVTEDVIAERTEVLPPARSRDTMGSSQLRQ